MLSKDEFVSLISKYNPDTDVALLGKSYDLSYRIHADQKRASGESYFTHPLAVALILAKKQFDDVSLAVALLHDVIEDSHLSVKDLSEEISEEVATLVEGVTKITTLEMHSVEEKQAENFRKLVLAMSKDIRVIIVKLADRLHNMRTLHFISKVEKRRRIAQETLDVYVPLVERLGIRDWKTELEDIAFSFLYPDDYLELQKKNNRLLKDGNKIISSCVEELQSVLKKASIECEIMGRCKTLYSIWCKIKKHSLSYEKVTDLIAFRVIVKDVEECYHVLGVLHGAYSTVPGRFKDYISLPKPNGYRSLHTGLIGPHNYRIEVQIRTQGMHEIAELGVAAHWLYKQRSSEEKMEGKRYRWMQEMLDILSNSRGGDGDFLKETKMAMFAEQVFVFSPNGDLYVLPRGASVVDFAYAVHTDIGNHCVSGAVNGRIVPLKTILKNGDQVSVTTSEKRFPSPSWFTFVVTGKARSCIRRYLRMLKREQYISFAKEMIKKEVKRLGYTYDEARLQNKYHHFDVSSVDDLLAKVGEGLVTKQAVVDHLYPEHLKDKKRTREDDILEAGYHEGDSAGEEGKPLLRGLIPGMVVHYAKCCHPLPGDPITGIVTTGRGVMVHHMDCKLLDRFSDVPERWLDISWSTSSVDNVEGMFSSRLSIVFANKIGSLSTVSSIISNEQSNVKDLRVVDRGDDFYRIVMDIEIHNRAHLSRVINRLKLSSLVFSVEKV